jgi:hypothetical protein
MNLALSLPALEADPLFAGVAVAAVVAYAIYYVARPRS